MNALRDEHPYASFIHRVEKPARYLGGEYQSIVKAWSDVSCRMCLAFPDLYDIGMSHMGTKILYSIVNKTPDLLVERCFTPWFDMEAELRERELPLLSLESHRPLRDFDVLGFSLQYEMTFTNVFTMMDLGGVPLRNAERTLDDPLVIAGGPTSTHPEPLAPFIDIFLIGDAEERLPRLLRHYAELKAEGRLSREEIIAEIAREGGVYAPDLYRRSIDPISGLEVVQEPTHEGVPALVERAFLDDISRYRFPDDSPVAVAEAIFDRMSVEIARGCTEGCRFCQAGMIYRPVRERDPEEIVDTLLSAIEKGGYDEAAITALSTADYSCISPLVKTLMDELRARKVSLGISSLRAYGLSETTLDDIASVKATGLTFAPEAGTQRMRDVINKNVDEDDIYATCHRVFEKGWKKIKLYFILGLPTEEDEDIVGIAEMGRQAREIGLEYRRNVQITVSVSSHVPKPHTPFQWARMDTLEEIERKQSILYRHSKQWRFVFRRHDMKVSHLEGIIARGDIRVGWLLERAWRLGARFDGWDEKLDWEAWMQAVEEFEERYGVDRRLYLDTIPVDARLPWDHIHVGLEDGFLLKEYRKALKDRLSPPCGKPFRAKVHHTNKQDALADERRLVCYDCGIACDLSEMREQRVEFLDKLGAHEPRGARTGPNARESAQARIAQGLTPYDFRQGEPTRYRIRYTKLGAVSLQGHLDLVRILPRVLRRIGVDAYYSEGFSPRPVMSFGPALGLGARALGEFADVSVLGDVEPADLIERFNRAAPDGLWFTGVRRLDAGDEPIAKVIAALETLVLFDAETSREAFGVDLSEEGALDAAIARINARIEEVRDNKRFPIEIWRKKRRRVVHLWDVVEELRAGRSDDFGEIGARLPGRPVLHLVQQFGHGGSIKPHEAANALFGVRLDTRSTARVACRSSLEDPMAVDPLMHGLEPGDPRVAEADIAQCQAWQSAARAYDRVAPSQAPDLLELASQ